MDVGAAASPFSGEMIASEARARDLTRPGAAAHAQSEEQARRVAEEFEAMTLAELLQPVFASIDPRGLGGGGAGEEMFRPMLVQEYATAMAKRGGIGLADSVVRELVRLQTASPTEDPDGPHR